jgi:hypothetical protein
MEGMWDRRSLQSAVLGSPVGRDARQVVFGATHIDRRQLEMCAPESEGRPDRKWFLAFPQLALHLNRRKPQA